MSIPATLIFKDYFYIHIYVHTHPHTYTPIHILLPFCPNLMRSLRSTSIFSFSRLLLASFPVHFHSNYRPSSQDTYNRLILILSLIYSFQKYLLYTIYGMILSATDIEISKINMIPAIS